MIETDYQNSKIEFFVFNQCVGIFYAASKELQNNRLEINLHYFKTETAHVLINKCCTPE